MSLAKGYISVVWVVKFLMFHVFGILIRITDRKTLANGLKRGSSIFKEYPAQIILYPYFLIQTGAFHQIHIRERK